MVLLQWSTRPKDTLNLNWFRAGEPVFWLGGPAAGAPACGLRDQQRSINTAIRLPRPQDVGWPSCVIWHRKVPPEGLWLCGNTRTGSCKSTLQTVRHRILPTRRSSGHLARTLHLDLSNKVVEKANSTRCLLLSGPLRAQGCGHAVGNTLPDCRVIAPSDVRKFLIK